MSVFCTLFDSYYLDRGIALYQSLEREADDFILYVFAFDQKTSEVLNALNFKSMKVVDTDAFETEELLMAKKNRSRAEYCWTCTSFVIQYVLDHFSVAECTYLDADLYFYNNPQILLQEFADKACQVGIVKHNFGKGIYDKRHSKASGKYCVQFNYFKNSPEARKVLSDWGQKCLERCSADNAGKGLGDQSYLDTWTSEYKNVVELQNLGGGVAPWNLYRYRNNTEDSTDFVLYDRITKQMVTLVFYHFHGIVFEEDKKVNIGVFVRFGRNAEDVVHKIYDPYLRNLIENRNMLKEDYGIVFQQRNSVKNTSKAAQNAIKKYYVSHEKTRVAKKFENIRSSGILLNSIESYQYHKNYKKDILVLGDKRND